MILLYIFSAVVVVMALLAIIKKPASVYKNKPEERNPMEGKIVRFVEDESEKKNADGVRGHLEAIGESNYKPGVYERIIKRAMDVFLSFFGLVVLSLVFLIISLWIIIDDAGSIIGTTAENPVKSRVCGIIV